MTRDEITAILKPVYELCEREHLVSFLLVHDPATAEMASFEGSETNLEFLITCWLIMDALIVTCEVNGETGLALVCKDFAGGIAHLCKARHGVDLKSGPDKNTELMPLRGSTKGTEH